MHQAPVVQGKDTEKASTLQTVKEEQSILPTTSVEKHLNQSELKPPRLHGWLDFSNVCS